MAAIVPRSRQCELCGCRPQVYCPADQAFLCQQCDERVHSANFIVLRHARSSLCQGCHRDTGLRLVGAREHLQVVPIAGGVPLAFLPTGASYCCACACAVESRALSTPGKRKGYSGIPSCLTTATQCQAPSVSIQQAEAAAQALEESQRVQAHAMRAWYLEAATAVHSRGPSGALCGLARQLPAEGTGSQHSAALESSGVLTALPSSVAQEDDASMPIWFQRRQCVNPAESPCLAPLKPAGASRGDQWLRLAMEDQDLLPPKQHEAHDAERVETKQLRWGDTRRRSCVTACEAVERDSGEEPIPKKQRLQGPGPLLSVFLSRRHLGSTSRLSASEMSTPGDAAPGSSSASSSGSCSGPLEGSSVRMPEALRRTRGPAPQAANVDKGSRGAAPSATLLGLPSLIQKRKFQADPEVQEVDTRKAAPGALEEAPIEEKASSSGENTAPLGRPASSRLKRVLRAWSDSLGGINVGTQNLAYELFQRTLSKMKRGEVAASFLRVTLAACLWMATKLVELRAHVPGAREVALVTAVDSADLKSTELTVLKLLDWQPLKHVSEKVKAEANAE